MTCVYEFEFFEEDGAVVALPFDMDGVPGISFPGIAPGETFTYRFPVRQSGTYWYHAHSGGQEQDGHLKATVAQGLQDLPAIQPRQHDVQDHQVVLTLQSQMQPVCAVRHKVRNVSRFGQSLPEVLPRLGLVFNNQYLHVRSPFTALNESVPNLKRPDMKITPM